MFNQDYEEYLRSILGYTPNGILENSYKNEYQQYPIQYDEDYWDINENYNRSELEQCYPDIYKLLYPIVQKECRNNTKPVTKDLVEEMTDKIYNEVTQNSEIQLNINIQNQTNNRVSEERTEVKETRQFNRNLNDIIKILILTELLRRGPRMPRPNYTNQPIRPPMRPPYNRDFNTYGNMVNYK